MLYPQWICNLVPSLITFAYLMFIIPKGVLYIIHLSPSYLFILIMGFNSCGMSMWRCLLYSHALVPCYPSRHKQAVTAGLTGLSIFSIIPAPYSFFSSSLRRVATHTPSPSWPFTSSSHSWILLAKQNSSHGGLEG